MDPPERPRRREQVSMTLDVDRYLPILNRKMQWELEKGPYVFALLQNGRDDPSTNVTLTCTG